jgi:hypothetical protein
MFRRIRSIVTERVISTGASTDYKLTIINSSNICTVPGNTTRSFGTNYDVTIEATSGAVYILPESTAEPTSNNAFKIPEGGILDLKVKSFLSIKGDSTTAKMQAIIWD